MHFIRFFSYNLVNVILPVFREKQKQKNIKHNTQQTESIRANS